MKENNSLIVRCDNAEHPPKIKILPFLIHIGKKEKVQESPEVTFYDVLTYIIGSLSKVRRQVKRKKIQRPR